MKNFNAAYLGKGAFKEQMSAMEKSSLKYLGKNSETTVNRLYDTNDSSSQFTSEAMKFSDKEMAHKILPFN